MKEEYKSLTYCNLKLSKEVIKLIITCGGNVPNTKNQVFHMIQQLNKVVKQQENDQSLMKEIELLKMQKSNLEMQN